MHIEGLNGNVSAKIDPNSISLFGSVNMFDSENTERPQSKKETQKTKIGSKYIDDEKYRKEMQDINTPIISSGANSKLHNDIISKIQQQQNKKTKPTKIKFKKPQALNQSTTAFGNYSSISDKTYTTNNLSQSMMIFPNNNKAEKGTNKTKKINFKGK